MRELVAIGVFGLVLLMGPIGCASTPASDIAALEASLSAADTTALAYVQLPKCGSTGAGSICSSPDIVKKIGAASKTAYTAVKTAQALQNSSNITAAQSAIIGLQSILSTVQIGG